MDCNCDPIQERWDVHNPRVEYLPKREDIVRCITAPHTLINIYSYRLTYGAYEKECLRYYYKLFLFC